MPDQEETHQVTHVGDASPAPAFGAETHVPEVPPRTPPFGAPPSHLDPHTVDPKTAHVHNFQRSGARSVTPKGESHLESCTICGEVRDGERIAVTPLTREAIDLLPDSAFAVIVAGGKKDKDGNTMPRDLRLLVHHDATEAVDADLLTAAIADELTTEMSDADHAKAKAHLADHAKK